MIGSGVALAALGAALGVMGATWVVSLARRDASLADIAWGPCLAAIAWACWAVGDDAGDRSLLLAALISLWAVRLAAHIAWRHDGEDRRYAAMRRRHGASFPLRSLWSVFGLQAAVAWVVALPVQAAASDGTPSGIGALAVVGATLALAAIAFEAVADLQLTRFLRTRGSEGVMDSGLWRYSRHPNYFGDASFWWAVWLIALEAGSPWWTAVGPALMTFLLLRVSGVTLTESTIAERRPAYREYVERTSAFVPLPPRR